MKLFQNWARGLGGVCSLSQLLKDGQADTLTVGYFLGTYSVRKSSQESVSTQQIPVNFYDINLILSKLALFICQLGLFRLFCNRFRKFKVPNKGPS